MLDNNQGSVFYFKVHLPTALVDIHITSHFCSIEKLIDFNFMYRSSNNWIYISQLLNKI